MRVTPETPECISTISACCISPSRLFIDRFRMSVQEESSGWGTL
jgi:hypothetical protein